MWPGDFQLGALGSVHACDRDGELGPLGGTSYRGYHRVRAQTTTLGDGLVVVSRQSNAKRGMQRTDGTPLLKCSGSSVDEFL